MSEKNSSEDMQIASVLGEVKGTLELLLRQSQQQYHSLNMRIDDYAKSTKEQMDSVNRLIDHQHENNSTRFQGVEERLSKQQDQIDERRFDGKKAVGSGGAAGGIISIGIELIKQIANNGS